MSTKRVRLDLDPLDLMELGSNFDPGISHCFDLRVEPENLVLSQSPPTPDLAPVGLDSSQPQITFENTSQFYSQTSVLSESPGLMLPTPDPSDMFSGALQRSIEDIGTSRTADIILSNSDLRNTLRDMLLSDARSEFKNSLTSSIMNQSNKDKDYLFHLTPTYLCNELKENAPRMFHIICCLLGIDEDSIDTDSNIRNLVAMLDSLIARHLNRKASGYAQVLTSMARDGGLREDSIKLFVIFSHPRTLQKFDKGRLHNKHNETLRNIFSKLSTTDRT